MVRRKRYSSSSYKGIRNLNKASGGKGFSRSKRTVNQDTDERGGDTLALRILLALVLAFIVSSILSDVLRL